MTDLRDRIAAAKFQLASWLFNRIDRWLDRYLDGLSDEKMEELYQRAKR